MSITVDYFFNHPDSLLSLAGQLNTWVGCSLSPYEGDPEDFFSRFLGMELSLSKHEFENDGECNFEDYAYWLSVRTPASLASLRPMQLPAVVHIAFVMRYWLDVARMLVFDGQNLLARYEARSEPGSGEPALYDLVSGEFVKFPAHIKVLEERVPGEWY
jgi:hypothetical protein